MKLTKLAYCPVPGSTAYTLDRCTVIVGQEQGDWHLSIAHPKRLPTWDEVKEVRYLLIPDKIRMALILPPKKEYVNVHNYCFHLWEIDR